MKVIIHIIILCRMCSINVSGCLPLAKGSLIMDEVKVM